MHSSFTPTVDQFYNRGPKLRHMSQDFLCLINMFTHGIHCIVVCDKLNPPGAFKYNSRVKEDGMTRTTSFFFFFNNFFIHTTYIYYGTLSELNASSCT